MWTRFSRASLTDTAHATAHQMLRAGTAGVHERLDQLFGGFDLADADGYGRFLTGHAAALFAVERALDVAGMAALLDDWPDRRRSGLIAADLAALGLPAPAPAPLAPLDDAGAAWGAAYVVEGSRLGGALLARQVADGLPKAYLATPLPKGAWRKFLVMLDEALYGHVMRASALSAALAVFTTFEESGQKALHS